MFCQTKIYLGKIILSILKIKSPKTLVCYTGPNYFQIKTRYLHYTIRIFTLNLSYANLSWGSTNRTNLKKLLSQQKHAVRIINNRTRFDHTNELFKSQKILNIYKLNILKQSGAEEFDLYMNTEWNFFTEIVRGVFQEQFRDVITPQALGNIPISFSFQNRENLTSQILKNFQLVQTQACYISF